ncbi:hypothetical protein QC3_1699 [Clostridioides difficile CD22]|nr:hypothetical protein QC3_1699 [Clostridioides difficile CD22]
MLIVKNLQVSFILTKWYVNKSMPTIGTSGLIGFILTKWYVNGV